VKFFTISGSPVCGSLDSPAPMDIQVREARPADIDFARALYFEMNAE
jgi:hypothetical protein